MVSKTMANPCFMIFVSHFCHEARWTVSNKYSSIDAVDNHFGGMGGGHYTAFCRNQVDNQWYNYDDSRVSKADVSSIQVGHFSSFLVIYAADRKAESCRLLAILPEKNQPTHRRRIEDQG